MERIISDEILAFHGTCRPACGRPSGSRPALPTTGPIVVAQTSTSSYTSIELRMPQPQTVIELLAEDGRALGRATIRYSTGGASAKPGPTLCSFRITAAAGADASLVEAAILADAPEHPETRAALAALRRETDADTASQRNLLAARVLLFRGVDAFLNAFVDPDTEAMWWLRAAPDVVSAHQPFLRWRGLRPVRGWWCLFLANKQDPKDFGTELSYAGAQETRGMRRCSRHGVPARRHRTHAHATRAANRGSCGVSGDSRASRRARDARGLGGCEHSIGGAVGQLSPIANNTFASDESADE